LETNKIDDIHLDIQINNNNKKNFLLKNMANDKIASSGAFIENKVESINRCCDLRKENLKIKNEFSMSSSNNEVKNPKSSEEEEKGSFLYIKALNSDINEKVENEY